MDPRPIKSALDAVVDLFLLVCFGMVSMGLVAGLFFIITLIRRAV